MMLSAEIVLGLIVLGIVVWAIKHIHRAVKSPERLPQERTGAIHIASRKKCLQPEEWDEVLGKEEHETPTN